ncbi:wolf-Hirschhorn syndrome candidate 1 [Culex quinquefasciatus]|uniref:Wolf-Hirschhorn syndrome candidate 1 n=1 Tax=Culex quinquefasciatus TaxID=7176 RepID=B0WHC0_CULQU|nr:wolf-Hirschhorn syndrome candidate 1 [Culex quinquefasciatus]|eukprot:XP_001848104.1 wolf-Hirschhorn syndrome candidate 1 [Culex quinquefasciatus]
MARQGFKQLQAEKSYVQESAPDDLSFKPPMYVNIKSSAARDEEEDSICKGKLLDKDPCGLHSNCINRALLLECNLKTCPAGEIHQNQCFKRKLELVAKEDAPGSVCDRVREGINTGELTRRIKQKQEQQGKNYYFMTVESELTIDAGPKGNLARFINHSCEPWCEPYCETLLWKVGGSQSVGLLKAHINYNFENFDDQKICHCGADKCSRLIVSQGTEN